VINKYQHRKSSRLGRDENEQRWRSASAGAAKAACGAEKQHGSVWTVARKIMAAHIFCLALLLGSRATSRAARINNRIVAASAAAQTSIGRRRSASADVKKKRISRLGDSGGGMPDRGKNRRRRGAACRVAAPRAPASRAPRDRLTCAAAAAWRQQHLLPARTPLQQHQPASLGGCIALHGRAHIAANWRASEKPESRLSNDGVAAAVSASGGIS